MKVGMKVMVASTTGQGELENDFSAALDGELVMLPALDCASGDRCGCVRAFSGIASHRGTTTAQIVERALGEADVHLAVVRSMVDGGWFDDVEHPEAAVAADELVGPLLDVAAEFPLGSVVRRHRDLLYVEQPPGASGSGG